MLIGYEMDWMVEYFMHTARTWDNWADAYVRRQSAVWK